LRNDERCTIGKRNESDSERAMTILAFSSHKKWIAAGSILCIHGRKRGKWFEEKSAGNTIFFSEKGATPSRLVAEYFRTEDIVLNSLIDLGSMDAIKELVKLGLGVSALAPWTALKELEEGSLVGLPLGRRKLRRRWGVLYWHGRQFSLAEETFIGLCESVSC
jgi:DNA-binding transcriptional LysR family regulator